MILDDLIRDSPDWKPKPSHKESNAESIDFMITPAKEEGHKFSNRKDKRST
jgi:hypothetical protein